MKTKVIIEQTLGGKWFWRATYPKNSGLPSVVSRSFGSQEEAEIDFWQAMVGREIIPKFQLDFIVKDSKFRGFSNE